MVTINSTNNKFRAMLQIDSDGYIGSPAYYGYMRSRSEVIIRLGAGVAAGIYLYKFSVTMGGTTREITYTSNPDGSLVVSLQKFMVMCGAGNSFGMFIDADITGTSERVGVTVNVLDGVSYNDIIAPMTNGLQGFTMVGTARHNVVPPNVMMSQPLGPDVIAESSLMNVLLTSATRPDAAWYGVSNGVEVEITPTGVRLNQLEVFGSYTELIYREQVNVETIEHRWTLEHPDTCDDIVMLEWTSLTGALRRHLFHIAELDCSVDETARLLSLHDGFKVAKNVSNGFKVRLEGLTAYSHWYYYDMLLANDLKAGVPLGWINDFQEVECAETNATTIINAQGFVDFEAVIRYKHYDTY